MSKGLFISMDGLDGCGKSTQVKNLANALNDLGYKVTKCVDPGGTQIGQTLREILLHNKSHIANRCEALLFMASRAQLVEQIILPALQDGSIVISDRFLLANVVYQGYGGGLNPTEIWQTGLLATGGLLPDLTFLLDLPVSLSRQRIGNPSDRMEQRPDEYFEKVRQGFIKEAELARQKIILLDASLPALMVSELIFEQVKKLLNQV